MSLPTGSGPPVVRASSGALVALGCAAVALTSSPVLAQEMDKFQEQQHTTFYNGNPVYTPGNASSAAPAGRR